MPWADSVPAIVHAWYLGNATGDAIADVLFGKKNPSGKLSLTFPKRLEDIPARGHFHSENGTVLYGEDLFVVSAEPYRRSMYRNFISGLQALPSQENIAYVCFRVSYNTTKCSINMTF